MALVDLTDIWPEWKVEKQIGIGSYGSVYKAVSHKAGVVCTSAIKVISIPNDITEIESLRYEGMNESDIRSYFKSATESLAEEISLMETLKGASNVVCIEDYKVVEKKDAFGWDIYIRMELLTKLNDFLCDKEVSEADVIKLGTDLCNALEICSKKNIIHRDIKPENIFVNDFGEYKLGDFGVAKKMEMLNSTMSQKGTFSFMAPEVAKSMHYDSRADIYSLGLVMYKLMNNNRLPFLNPNKQILNHTERHMAIERRIRGEELLPPVNASMPLSNIILKACAYDINDRYSSAKKMKTDLQVLNYKAYFENHGNNFDDDFYPGDNGGYRENFENDGWNGGYAEQNNGIDWNGGYAEQNNGNDRNRGYAEQNNGNDWNGGYAEQNNGNDWNGGYAEQNNGWNENNVYTRSEKKAIPSIDDGNHDIVADSSETLPAKRTKFKNILTRKEKVIIALSILVLCFAITIYSITCYRRSRVEIPDTDMIETEKTYDQYDFLFCEDFEPFTTISLYEAEDVLGTAVADDKAYFAHSSNVEEIKVLLRNGKYSEATDKLFEIMNTTGYLKRVAMEAAYNVEEYDGIKPVIPGYTDNGDKYDVVRIYIGSGCNFTCIGINKSLDLNNDLAGMGADYYALSIPVENSERNAGILVNEYFYMDSKGNYIGGIENVE